MEINSNTKCIDGLRAYAITLIVLSHVGILNQGGVGNCIFFCISGFLAVSPFSVREGYLFKNKDDVISYWVKKIIRIWPIYALVVVSVKYLTGRIFFGDKIAVIKQLLFIESSGILWYIQQLMIIYMLFPIISIFVERIAKQCKCIDFSLMCAIISAGLVVIAYFYVFPNIKIRTLSAVPNGFRLFQFLIGMTAAYLYKLLSKLDRGKGKKWASVFSVLILCLGVLTSDSFLPYISLKYIGYYIGWQRPFEVTVVVAILILLLLLYPENVASVFLKRKAITFIGSQVLNCV